MPILAQLPGAKSHELLKESSDSLHVPAAPGTWHLVIEQE